jgi:hypothetical protein
MAEFGFDAIKQVSGWASLGAFVTMAALTAVRSVVRKDIELLQGVAGSPEEIAAKERIAKAALERVPVDTSEWPNEAKAKFAIAQLEERRHRLKIIAALILALAITTAAVAVIAIIIQFDVRRSSSADPLRIPNSELSVVSIRHSKQDVSAIQATIRNNWSRKQILTTAKIKIIECDIVGPMIPNNSQCTMAARAGTTTRTSIG